MLDPVGAAMFLHVWDRIDNQFRLDDEQTLTDGVVARTRGQRRADALVEMANRAGAD